MPVYVYGPAPNGGTPCRAPVKSWTASCVVYSAPQVVPACYSNVVLPPAVSYPSIQSPTFHSVIVSNPIPVAVTPHFTVHAPAVAKPAVFVPTPFEKVNEQLPGIRAERRPDKSVTFTFKVRTDDPSFQIGYQMADNRTNVGSPTTISGVNEEGRKFTTSALTIDGVYHAKLQHGPGGSVDYTVTVAPSMKMLKLTVGNKSVVLDVDKAGAPKAPQVMTNVTGPTIQPPVVNHANPPPTIVAKGLQQPLPKGKGHNAVMAVSGASDPSQVETIQTIPREVPGAKTIVAGPPTGNPGAQDKAGKGEALKVQLAAPPVIAHTGGANQDKAGKGDALKVQLAAPPVIPVTGGSNQDKAGKGDASKVLLAAPPVIPVTGGSNIGGSNNFATVNAPGSGGGRWDPADSWREPLTGYFDLARLQKLKAGGPQLGLGAVSKSTTGAGHHGSGKGPVLFPGVLGFRGPDTEQYAGGGGSLQALAGAFGDFKQAPNAGGGVLFNQSKTLGGKQIGVRKGVEGGIVRERYKDLLFDNSMKLGGEGAGPIKEGPLLILGEDRQTLELGTSEPSDGALKALGINKVGKRLIRTPSLNNE